MFGKGANTRRGLRQRVALTRLDRFERLLQALDTLLETR